MNECDSMYEFRWAIEVIPDVHSMMLRCRWMLFWKRCFIESLVSREGMALTATSKGFGESHSVPFTSSSTTYLQNHTSLIRHSSPQTKQVRVEHQIHSFRSCSPLQSPHHTKQPIMNRSIMRKTPKLLVTNHPLISRKYTQERKEMHVHSLTG